MVRNCTTAVPTSHHSVLWPAYLCKRFAALLFCPFTLLLLIRPECTPSAPTKHLLDLSWRSFNFCRHVVPQPHRGHQRREAVDALPAGGPHAAASSVSYALLAHAACLQPYSDPFPPPH